MQTKMTKPELFSYAPTPNVILCQKRKSNLHMNSFVACIKLCAVAQKLSMKFSTL